MLQALLVGAALALVLGAPAMGHMSSFCSFCLVAQAGMSESGCGGLENTSTAFSLCGCLMCSFSVFDPLTLAVLGGECLHLTLPAGRAGNPSAQRPRDGDGGGCCQKA